MDVLLKGMESDEHRSTGQSVFDFEEIRRELRLNWPRRFLGSREDMPRIPVALRARRPREPLVSRCRKSERREMAEVMVFAEKLP